MGKVDIDQGQLKIGPLGGSIIAWIELNNCPFAKPTTVPLLNKLPSIILFNSHSLQNLELENQN
jgi:hypothetical protein